MTEATCEMRRGFKAHATRLAIEVRYEIGLDPHAVLDPVDLAHEYGIPVYPLSEAVNFGCSASALEYFSDPGRKSFSAALVPDGTGRFIIENDRHAATRRRSNIAHEMAHVLLEHSFPTLILGAEGCRAVDPDTESEADWFAGELLIPSDAARLLALKGLSNDAIARHFGISEQLAAMRMNVSGARKLAARTRDSRQKLHGGSAPKT